MRGRTTWIRPAERSMLPTPSVSGAVGGSEVPTHFWHSGRLGLMRVARWCCQLTTDRDEPGRQNTSGSTPRCMPDDVVSAGLLPASTQDPLGSAGEPETAALPCSSRGETPAGLFNGRRIKV